VWAAVKLFLCIFQFKLKIEKVNKITDNCINKEKKMINYNFKRMYKTNNKIIKKINQIGVGYGKLQGALNTYEKESGLMFIDRLSTVFLIAGFFS
jgi:hypothetical protein